MHPVLDVGPADRRRALRPERQRPVGAVGEAVHLLLHDVGALPGGAGEERRVLEHGRQDLAVAVQRAETLDLARDALPERHLRGDDVVGAARSLDPAAHGCARAARSSARNGFRGELRGERRLAGRGRDARRCRAGRRRAATPIDACRMPQSPPGRSVRPTEPANRTSPEKRWPSAKNARCPGEWPGTRVTANEMPGRLDRLSSLEPDVRLRRRGRVDPGRRERVGLFDQDSLPCGRVDGRAGLARRGRRG